MLLFILEDLQSFENCTGIMIPGSSGIPGWVLHQEMEREVRIELPVNWYRDNHFLGFVLFCLYQNDNEYHLTCDLKLYDDDSYEVVDRVGFPFRCEYCKINDAISDELWVTYYPKICIPEKYHSNQFRNFQASFSATILDDDTISGDIKRCGIHLIHPQDHQQKNTVLLDFLGTQDDEHNHMPVLLDHPDNFQDNIESIAEDANGRVKRSRDDAEQNQGEEPPHKRLRTSISIFDLLTQAVMKIFR